MGHCGEKRSDRPYRHSDKRRAERQWRGEAGDDHMDWNLCLGCPMCDDQMADLDELGGP